MRKRFFPHFWMRIPFKICLEKYIRTKKHYFVSFLKNNIFIKTYLNNHKSCIGSSIASPSFSNFSFSSFPCDYSPSFSSCSSLTSLASSIITSFTYSSYGNSYTGCSLESISSPGVSSYSFVSIVGELSFSSSGKDYS